LIAILQRLSVLESHQPGISRYDQIRIHARDDSYSLDQASVGHQKTLVSHETRDEVDHQHKDAEGEDEDDTDKSGNDEESETNSLFDYDGSAEEEEEEDISTY
jgi:hypothetical protein